MVCDAYVFSSSLRDTWASTALFSFKLSSVVVFRRKSFDMVWVIFTTICSHRESSNALSLETPAIRCCAES